MSNDNLSRTVPKSVALRQAVNQSLIYTGKVGKSRLGRVSSAALTTSEAFEVNLALSLIHI